MIDDFCLHRVKDEVHVGVEQLLTQNSMWHPNLCFLLYSATCRIDDGAALDARTGMAYTPWESAAGPRILLLRG